MRFLKVLAFVCIATNGHAVAFASENVADQTTLQEQRRAELRAALKARTVHSTADPHGELTPPITPVKRHLSDVERADLRRQLHQQRRTGKSDHP